MVSTFDAPVLSANTSAADWIRERLSPFDAHLVSSVIPNGFDAYVRILHPVQVPRGDDRLVRWLDVSRWSGVPIHPEVQWHDIALPETTPVSDPPWRSQGPEQGSLFMADAETLIEDLALHSSTTRECYFCLWIGYFGAGALFVSAGSPPVSTPTPTQPPCLVELPAREYGLFEGPLTSATHLREENDLDQRTPNLWWPNDHSWCVASEIDLPWTYVGGSSELIERLLADERLETVVAAPGAPITTELADWLTPFIENATNEVVQNGSATITLALGTVSVQWTPPRLFRPGTIATSVQRAHSGGSGSTPLRTRDAGEIKGRIAFAIERAILSLTEV